LPVFTAFLKASYSHWGPPLTSIQLDTNVPRATFDAVMNGHRVDFPLVRR